MLFSAYFTRTLRREIDVIVELIAEIASQTRDPRFVPILASRLTSSGISPAERTAAIERLVQIGGSEATELLVRVFDSLTPMQQEPVLGHLWREDPARALPLAEKLVSTATAVLPPPKKPAPPSSCSEA